MFFNSLLIIRMSNYIQQIISNSIESLDLSNIYETSAEQIVQIITLMHTNRSIHTLILDNNPLPDEMGVSICTLVINMLKINRRLETLSLKNCCIDSTDFIELIRCINEYTSLRVLDVSNNCPNIVTHEVSHLLSSNTSLHSLNLSENSIDDDGVLHIVEMLNKNSCLQELIIRCNSITSKGILKIFEILNVNNSLNILDISWSNFIFDDESIKFANFLCENTSLHTLIMKSYHIDNEKIDEIAKILELNYVLTKIVFSVDNENISKLVERNKEIVQNKRFIKIKPVSCF